MCILILGSFFGPPFFLAWFTGVEEKSARCCCCCWAMQPRAVAAGACVRQRGENVRKSAVEGAFIIVPWIPSEVVIITILWYRGSIEGLRELGPTRLGLVEIRT